MPSPIILVDDCESDCIVARRSYLRSDLAQSGPLIEFSTGDAFLNYADATSDDLSNSIVFLDINMPGLSGFEVLDLARKHPRLKEAVIVIFTTSQNPIDKEKAENLGANSYKIKPFSILEYIEVFNSFA